MTHAISILLKKKFQISRANSQCKRKWSTVSPFFLHIQHHSVMIMPLLLRLSIDMGHETEVQLGRHTEVQLGQDLLAGLKGKGLDLGPSLRRKWVDTGRRYPATFDISAKPKSSISEPIFEQRATKSTHIFSVVSEEVDGGPVEASLAVVMGEGELLGSDGDSACNPTSVDEELTLSMGQKTPTTSNMTLCNPTSLQETHSTLMSEPRTAGRLMSAMESLGQTQTMSLEEEEPIASEEHPTLGEEDEIPNVEGVKASRVKENVEEKERREVEGEGSMVLFEGEDFSEDPSPVSVVAQDV